MFVTTFILVCLVHDQFIQLIFCATLPTIYEPPTLILGSRYNMTQMANLGNPSGTSYVSMETTDSTVSRLTNFGKLEIFDIDTKTMKFNLFSSTNSPTNQSVRAYDILDGSPLILGVILTNNNVFLYNAYSSASLVQFQYTKDLNAYERQSIQIFDDQYYLYSSTGPTSQYIGIRTKSSGWALTQSYSSSIKTIIFNSKKCRVNPTDKSYRTANWKMSCLVQILNCKIGGACTQIFLDNNTACTSTEFKDTTRDYSLLDWNHDCTKVIYEYKNAGIKIVDITTNSSTIVSLTAPSTGVSIHGLWFMDLFGKYVGLIWADGRFQIYSILSSVKKVDEKIVEKNTVAAYRRSKQMLFVTNGSNLYAYNFGCNSSNFSLDANGLCLPVPLNMTKNTTTNTTSNSTANTTTNITTNTTINTTKIDPIINTTLNVTTDANTTTNINTDTPYQNTTYMDLTGENSTLDQVDPKIDEKIANTTNQKKEQSDYQNSFTKFTTNFFVSVQQAVSYSLLLIRILPIAAFLMRYINFWSICTMYLLPELFLPQKLTEIITQICSFINFSIFKQIGWNLSFDTNLVEKFSDFENQIFGFSSDIFNSNIENVLLFCFSNLMLAISFGLSTLLTSRGFLQKHLSAINYRKILLAQFVSMMQVFIFNFPIITLKSEQGFFMQKVNMSFQNVLFIFSVFVSCFAFITFEERIENQTVKNNEKKREKYDWFFDSQCRVLLPIIATINKNFLFLGFSAILLWLPVLTALKRSKFRFWYILRALYLPIFNICVILLQILREKELKEIEDQVGFVTIIIVFAGAMHEILEFIVIVIYGIVKMLCKKDSKVVDAFELQKIDDLVNRLSLDRCSEGIWTESTRGSFTKKMPIAFLSNEKQIIKTQPNEQKFSGMIFNHDFEYQNKFDGIPLRSRFKKIKTARKPFTKHFIQQSNQQKQGSVRSIQRNLRSNNFLKEKDFKEEAKTQKKIHTTKIIVHNRAKYSREKRSKKLI